MISKSFIEEIVEEHIGNTDKFLIDVKVRTGNIIQILIDGDNGVTIDDCVSVSRAVEGKLDRDVEDFELKVSSAGLDYPLSTERQYRKNIGRQIKVALEMGDTLSGELKEVNKDGIKIMLAPEKRKKGQSKAALLEERDLAFVEIKETKIIVVF